MSSSDRCCSGPKSKIIVVVLSAIAECFACRITICSTCDPHLVTLIKPAWEIYGVDALHCLSYDDPVLEHSKRPNLLNLKSEFSFSICALSSTRLNRLITGWSRLCHTNLLQTFDNVAQVLYCTYACRTCCMQAVRRYSTGKGERMIDIRFFVILCGVWTVDSFTNLLSTCLMVCSILGSRPISFPNLFLLSTPSPTDWLLGKWIGTLLVVFGVVNLVKCPD